MIPAIAAAFAAIVAIMDIDRNTGACGGEVRRRHGEA
jgi:hypothetical protein